jgi:hypothetical protein
MKHLRIAVFLAMTFGANAVMAQTAAQKSFDQLKALAGTWEGKNANGDPVQVSFRVTAAGSAVMSEIMSHGEQMISMIHLDGANRLLLTHYCTAGNQPRLLATASPDGGTIAFYFLDATDLDSPEAGHMDRVVMKTLEANHHTEEWNFVDHGKELKEVFDLKRKN